MSPQRCPVSIINRITYAEWCKGFPGSYQGAVQRVLVHNTSVNPVGGSSTSHCISSHGTVFLFPEEIWLDVPKDFQLLVKDYVTYFKHVFLWGK